LPLPGCDSAWRCQCVYKHFEDRRAGPRRTIEREGIAGPWFAAERRQSGGRRAGDGSGQ
jgi:hypothetical protein